MRRTPLELPAIGYWIREAREEDLDVLAEIERAAAIRFAPFGLDVVMASVTTPRGRLELGLETGRLVVAAEAPPGAVVGFALSCVLDGDAHLEEIDVLPAHGRKGIGHALVLSAIAIGRREGRARMTLSTLRDVPWNAPWYARFGFRELAPHEIGPELAASCSIDRERGLPDDGRVILGLTIPPI